MMNIGGMTYEVVKDFRNGWNPEAFRSRYSEVLERYDYIVGDWGYNQLRLKGFFLETNPRSSKESSVAGLQDYLQEYCNFGCAHFVVQKVKDRPRTAEEEKALSIEEEYAPQPGEAGVKQDGDAPAAERRPQERHWNEGRSHERRPRSHGKSFEPKGQAGAEGRSSENRRSESRGDARGDSRSDHRKQDARHDGKGARSNEQRPSRPNKNQNAHGQSRGGGQSYKQQGQGKRNPPPSQERGRPS
ncbi:YutD family protein [Paenibacillus turpanensis]|uniref:YutD family protein n=1 Tax=Paenibacillus turpanensis TaxID=2689078 RepID=UPI0014075403|nr:YutD family protein [Paenibacillus turpanensis]